ncbi:hypothetical protein [Alkalihalobacterium elongatum]|uniref:hypothetical protein n=1 Tax=Alkalihalobacterium elongatum TaxID=2675466 RepID=UPI001C1FB532|nr:hypothetical protein [Alkalihalobacterium elongatum]
MFETEVVVGEERQLMIIGAGVKRGLMQESEMLVGVGVGFNTGILLFEIIVTKLLLGV